MSVKYSTGGLLEESANLSTLEEVHSLVPCVIRDIPSMIDYLDKLQTRLDKESIAWMQAVMSACYQVIRRCVNTE